MARPSGRNPASKSKRSQPPSGGPRKSGAQHRSGPHGEAGNERRPAQQREDAKAPPRPDGALSLYGLHAAAAAIDNPARSVMEIIATKQGAERLAEGGRRFDARMASARDIDALLPPDAVHQGILVYARPLAAPDLMDIAADPDPARPVLVLDQITDPRNIGAVLRSAAAFGARAVIVHDRSTPPLDGALAKAAAGAVDIVPIIRAGNIARALEELGDLGYQRIGLAGETGASLAEALRFAAPAPVAIALGAEGPGLRRLTRERCDALARIPMPGAMESLNVSVAAAIALYAATAG